MRNFLLLTTTAAFFVTLFFSCSNPTSIPPPPDLQTEIFSHYLNYNFADSISNEHHIYVLISKNDSRENISEILDKLKMKLFLKKTGSISTIISSAIPVADSLLPAGKISTDWDGAIDKLKLPLTGVTLIQTSQKKLVALLPLTIANAENENGFLNW